VAIVTGASSGIGRATAERLGAEGARVARVARREDRLESAAEAVEAAGGEALVAPGDVTDPDAVAAAVDRTVDAFGALDVAVVNAGIGSPREDLASLALDDYRTMRAVNADGAAFTARATLPHLRETSGALVFVGSFSGAYPRPDFPVYAATKWFVRGLALSLAGAAGPDGVAVSLVNPSEVRSELNDTFGTPNAERLAPGEATEPAAVADAIAYAAAADPPDTVTELDLYRRDRFEGF
jgi:NADP-dependent 3-hydroxy acid dehydrogenase YdfG